jgi:hypothetical protein
VHIHRLVMWAFVGPQEKGVHVRHLDGDPQNNRLENLAYGSPWDDITDTFRPAGITGSGITETGVVIGRALEKRIRAALDGNANPHQVLTDILELLESSKNQSLAHEPKAT